MDSMDSNHEEKTNFTWFGCISVTTRGHGIVEIRG